ncbi:hypothetical protein RIF29_12493 [Crotalaria pallida]|uniref:F-box domain-containing protein n=1 Tax=Crotalaria pallida TaxID=3830 RepID=A0AAN9P255_CROPI
MDVVDRISCLPDEVICHILSFVTSQEAVATSILSKRWYPLWRSLSVIILQHENNLIFCAATTASYRRFSNFVSSLLRLRDVSLPIKKFRFMRISNTIHAQDITTWFHFVLERYVNDLQHLHLAVCHIPDFFIPYSLWDLPVSQTLRCKNLVVLKLSMFNVDLTTTTTIEEDNNELSLPCLRALHLLTVKFKSVECLSKLLSGCPILEDFKGLSISYHGSSISSIIFVLVDKFKSSLSKLREAFIHLRGRIMVPLELVYNVKELTLSIESVSPCYTSIPTFSNLTKLMLSLDERNNTRPWLMRVLNHCPKLQILQLQIMRFEYHDDDDDDDEWVCPKFVPECVSLSLRECTIHCYKDVEAGPRFARYIMQNASVLRAMRICTRRSEDLEFTIAKELPLCQKRSPTCQLSFVDAAHPASRSFF